jgi:hypothetical protein
LIEFPAADDLIGIEFEFGEKTGGIGGHRIAEADHIKPSAALKGFGHQNLILTRKIIR